METATQFILESLRSAPLLIGDLPEASVFDRSLLGESSVAEPLRFDQKLGHLYEQALERLIESSASLTLLASHLQVFAEGGRTLGELDFLVNDRIAKRHVHLELAIKFYLAVQCGEVWEFPGPDPRDNWPRKLDRLRTHQLQLSQTPEARELLQQRFGIESVEVRQLIYGCLFLPLACEQIPELAFLSSGARIGRWLYSNEWGQHFHGVDEVCLVPKPLWPVELSAEAKSQLEVVTVSRLHELSAERCTMFCLPDSAVPYFLVPPTWLG